MKSRTSNWTSVTLVTFLLLLGIPGLAAAQSGNNGFTQQQTNNPQPVLIYTVSGSTIAGTTLSTLVVYSNGLAVWADNGNGGNSGNGGNGSNSFQTSQLTRAQLDQFTRDLRQAGAFRMAGRNNQQQTPDTPLTTITVFSNTGNNGVSIAHTFSFYSPDAGRGRVNDFVNNFLNNNFNGGTGGTGGQ
jgi:hypothetical protein